jgi:hypothetical protein
VVEEVEEVKGRDNLTLINRAPARKKIGPGSGLGRRCETGYLVGAGASEPCGTIAWIWLIVKSVIVRYGHDSNVRCGSGVDAGVGGDFGVS